MRRTSCACGESHTLRQRRQGHIDELIDGVELGASGGSPSAGVDLLPDLLESGDQAVAKLFERCAVRGGICLFEEQGTMLFQACFDGGACDGSGLLGDGVQASGQRFASIGRESSCVVDSLSEEQGFLVLEGLLQTSNLRIDAFGGCADCLRQALRSRNGRSSGEGLAEYFALLACVAEILCGTLGRGVLRGVGEGDREDPRRLDLECCCPSLACRCARSFGLGQRRAIRRSTRIRSGVGARWSDAQTRRASARVASMSSAVRRVTESSAWVPGATSAMM
jgi:hypothetical protein